MDTPIPKRLRATLGDQGKIISHGQSLEVIAQQYVLRDWNTLNVMEQEETRTNQLERNVGQIVSGQYLGHKLKGQIKSAF